MPDPRTCRFSESHEWMHLEGDVVTVGITQFAADELTDITYVEMKRVGTAIEAGESVGEVESVKTTADIYSAVGGEIVAVNESVSADPALVNSDPYGEGWLLKIRAVDTAPLDALMDHGSYTQKHPVS